MDYSFCGRSSARLHALRHDDLPRQISRCSTLRPVLRAGNHAVSCGLETVVNSVVRVSKSFKEGSDLILCVPLDHSKDVWDFVSESVESSAQESCHRRQCPVLLLPLLGPSICLHSFVFNLCHGVLDLLVLGCESVVGCFDQVVRCFELVVLCLQLRNALIRGRGV